MISKGKVENPSLDERTCRVVMKRISRPVEFFLKNLILSLLPLRDEFVLVTGADKTHYKSLVNLMRSIGTWEPNARVVVYDLGLDRHQRKDLALSFPSADIRVFDYSKYPDYFDIRKNAGEFAWKPVIFSDVFFETRSSVCWFDAGNIVTEPLTRLRKIVQWTGFYSPFGKDTVADWTHPSTLAFLKSDKSILKKHTLAGGCIAANFRFPKARLFVEKWRECALIKECIAPPGSNRYNHRQDMSVMTILAHQISLPLFMSSFKLGFTFQQDVD